LPCGLKVSETSRCHPGQLSTSTECLFGSTVDNQSNSLPVTFQQTCQLLHPSASNSRASWFNQFWTAAPFALPLLYCSCFYRIHIHRFNIDPPPVALDRRLSLSSPPPHRTPLPRQRSFSDISSLNPHDRHQLCEHLFASSACSKISLSYSSLAMAGQENHPPQAGPIGTSMLTILMFQFRTVSPFLL